NGPIATLKDGHHTPNGCAVDPSGGDLAVANLSSTGLTGNVAVYAGAHGGPAFHRATGMYDYFFCGYDDAGNLYVSGTSKNGVVSLAELPKGKKQFVKITIDKPLAAAGPIEWDGKHLALGYANSKSSLIYRIDVSGNKATVVGTVQLSAPRAPHASMGPFWIA